MFLLMIWRINFT